MKWRLSLRQLIAVCLGVLTLVIAVAISGSIISQMAADRLVSELENHFLPVQKRTSELFRAYVDQETGQRGFLLTGDPVTLKPYNSGSSRVEVLIPELRSELALASHGDELLSSFEEFVAAGAAWKHQAAEPQIAAQRAGSIPPETVGQTVLDGKILFDTVRDRADALNAQIESLIAEHLHQLRSMQRTTNTVRYCAAAALVSTIIGLVIWVTQTLTRPVAQLVRDVRAVASGVYDSPIGGAGPSEVQQISTAVKEMRDSLIEANNKLETGRQRFAAVVANTPSAISVRDLQHRFTLVNDSFLRLFKHESVEAVIGRTEEEILPPDVFQRSQRAAAQLLAGDSLLEEESIRLGPENISVMTQRFPLSNSAGAMEELVTMRTDVTHRRKIEHEIAERDMWAERIGTAIDDGRLLVYSQPIVAIETREPVAEELLVRLRDVDSDEILPPSEFLPQCERHALMPVIDRYMIGRAIELADSGRHVCVNITGQTIADAPTMTAILEALTIAGPGVTDKIVFEITETTALASPEIAKAFSVSMRDRGCRVALDDFGTGYGTFTELRNLALYALKIDLSFVQNMLEDRDDERVVNTIVLVAKTYGLTTIAEGVESEAILARLAELGADCAQGYLFGKPTAILT